MPPNPVEPPIRYWAQLLTTAVRITNTPKLAESSFGLDRRSQRIQHQHIEENVDRVVMDEDRRDEPPELPGFNVMPTIPSVPVPRLDDRYRIPERQFAQPRLGLLPEVAEQRHRDRDTDQDQRQGDASWLGWSPDLRAHIDHLFRASTFLYVLLSAQPISLRNSRSVPGVVGRSRELLQRFTGCLQLVLIANPNDPAAVSFLGEDIDVLCDEKAGEAIGLLSVGQISDLSHDLRFIRAGRVLARLRAVPRQASQPKNSMKNCLPACIPCPESIWNGFC